MIANGYDVAVLNHHSGDEYQTTASTGRISYLGIGGFPTAYFDGGSAVVGGSSNTYPQYVSRYNQKIAIPSSFSIDIQGSSSGLIDFNVDVTIEKVDASYTGTDVRLHCAITETNIPEYWGGQTHVNNVNRMMLPSHNGTPLDFSAGNIIEQTYSFSLDPSWVAENCEIVIFLEEHSAKTILNANLEELIDFGNVNDYDASLSYLANLPEKSCTGTFEPSFVLRNNGNQDLNNLTINYMVNGGDVSTYNWTGDLAFLEEETVYLPAIAFTPADENIIYIESENPNGNPDQYPLNDTISRNVPAADITPTMVSLILRTDNNPGETTWEITDADGTVVHSGGPYSTPSQMIQEDFQLDALSCYQFYVYDAGGDGLAAPGFFALYYDANTYILQGMGDFGASLGTDFSTDDDTGIEEIITDAEVKVYPNPFSNYTNIAITTKEVSHIRVNMYNILGGLVYQSDEGILAAGEQMIRINGESLQNGVYFVQLLVNEHVITERVTVVR